MATVVIPTPLRKFTNNSSRIIIHDTDVAGILRQLTRGFPDLKKYLIDPDGRIAPFINVFVDSQDIRNLNMDDTVVNEKTVISIVPAIAGGVPNKKLR